MRYLKSFKKINESIFDDISDICARYSIHNWNLNDDGTIDVNNNVNLYESDLESLPLNFRNIYGDFFCFGNRLISLKGCPISVSGHFDCGLNDLIYLEGCPQLVGGDFDCSNNNLVSLKGCPISVGRYFNCDNNNLTSLIGLSKSIAGNFFCVSNNIKDFEGICLVDGSLHFEGNPIYNIWKLFKDKDHIELLNDYDAIRGDEIILDRLNDFLKVIGKDPVTEVEGYKVI